MKTIFRGELFPSNPANPAIVLYKQVQTKEAAINGFMRYLHTQVETPEGYTLRWVGKMLPEIDPLTFFSASQLVDLDNFEVVTNTIKDVK